MAAEPAWGLKCCTQFRFIPVIQMTRIKKSVAARLAEKKVELRFLLQVAM